VSTGAVDPAAVSELPFSYQGSGQGGSTTSFSVSVDGNYAVTYHIAGVAAVAPCTVSLGLSSAQAAVTVASGIRVDASESKEGTATVHLTTGVWRAVEGGGCDWTVAIAVG
jgi:hypothetical protein